MPLPTFEDTNAIKHTLRAYEEYRNQLADGTPKIWSIDRIDHMRLPGNIDITELLIYIGFLWKKWLEEIGYQGEIPIYSPNYPDNIYTVENIGNAPVTQDSPHKKIPMSICYGVKYRAPATMKGSPFQGDKKQWKFRNAGEFETVDGKIYNIRVRHLENLANFTVMARSGQEVDWLARVWEVFMETAGGDILEAGCQKYAFYGRPAEGDKVMDSVGYLHYRRLLYWFRTEEFKYAGPVSSKIGEMDIEAMPTGI